jgi:hypothetical protein
MPDEHSARLDRARAKEKQIDEWVQRRSRAAALLENLKDLPSLGRMTARSAVRVYRARLVEAAQPLVALGFGEQLKNLKAPDNEAKAEAIEIYQLAQGRATEATPGRRRRELAEVMRRLRALAKPGNASFSVAVEGLLRGGLAREILGDLLNVHLGSWNVQQAFVREVVPMVLGGPLDEQPDTWQALEESCSRAFWALRMLRTNEVEDLATDLIRGLWRHAEGAGGLDDLPPRMPKVNDVSSGLRAVQKLPRWIRRHQQPSPGGPGRAGGHGADRNPMPDGDGERHHAQMSEDSAIEPPADELWPAYMSARDLADRLCLSREATRKKLARLAANHDCFIENESPRKGEAKRLYRVADVLPELRD